MGRKLTAEEQLAKMIEEAVVRKHGKDWRRYLVPEIQKAVVSQEILRTVLGWRTVPFTHEDVLKLTVATMARMFPESEDEG